MGMSIELVLRTLTSQAPEDFSTFGESQNTKAIALPTNTGAPLWPYSRITFEETKTSRSPALHQAKEGKS